MLDSIFYKLGKIYTNVVSIGRNILLIAAAVTTATTLLIEKLADAMSSDIAGTMDELGIFNTYTIINGFIPLGEGLQMSTAYFTLFVAITFFRWFKSFIPFVSN